jgi:hypothetical protein
MIKPHVASSLWLQLIMEVYKITFNVDICGNLVLHYHLSFMLEMILIYINLPTKQK